MAVERDWPCYKIGMKKDAGKLGSNWNSLFIYSLCIYLRDGILTSTIPRYNSERAPLPSWRKRHGWRTPSSDLSTPFALTSKSLWDISDPNIATIKSRLTFENKQEYHTRWDACKLPEFFFGFGQFLLWPIINLGNCTFPSHSCDWL